jgi:hypothetical protein
MNWKFTDATRVAVYRVHDDGTIESHSVEQPDIAAWIAGGGVADEPDPAPPVTRISYSALRARMSAAERQAVLTACRGNWQLDDFVRLAQAEGEIDLASDVTAAAKAALVSGGLLTQERATEIFSAS